MMTLEKLIERKDYHLGQVEKITAKIGTVLKNGGKDYMLNAALQACIPHYTNSLSSIKAPGRNRGIAIQRQIMMTLIQRHCNFKPAEIGEMFNRDRSIIYHSQQVINDLCFTDRRFNEQWQAIERAFLILIN